MHYTHGKPFCLSLVPQLVLALPSLTVVDHAPCSAHALQTLSARPSAEQHTRHPSWMLQSEMLSASTLAGAPRRGELFRRSPGSVIGAIPPTHNKITDDLMTVLRVGRGDRIKLWKCSAAFCCAHDYSSRVERAAQHHPTLQSRSKPPRHAFNSTCIDTTLCLHINSRHPTGKATALVVETWRCLCLVATRSSVT